MKRNIVLIGMPGCGKTRVGMALSRKLGMPLLDTDKMVEQATGRSVREIFAEDGEAAFRDMETAAAREAAGREGVIIATGGGMVLREENMAALAATGYVFFRDRDPDAIAGEDHRGRPLMAGGRDRVYQLYEERIGYYRRYAEYTISHTDTVEEAADQIAAIFRKECAKS